MKLAQMKSDFVSNVSHELRTPLALIRMYAETLEMGRVRTESKKQDYYRIVRQETERLTRLINNILNFSRIESGRKEYHFSNVQINNCVEKILDMYHFHIQSKGFTIETELKEALPEISADEEAICESLINLLDNAMKYSKENKKIAVRTGVENGQVYIEVEDHGIGISPDQQKLIFDKFYRVSSALVHETKGSGLGLTLVRHIAQKHGGEITVKSELKKGSKFRVTLPVDKKKPVDTNV
jgi:signal transduction histidine kinase